MNLEKRLQTLVNYFTKEHYYWDENILVRLDSGTLGTSSICGKSSAFPYVGAEECHGFAQLIIGLITGYKFNIATDEITSKALSSHLNQNIYEVYTRAYSEFYPFKLDGTVFKNVDANGFHLKVGDFIRLPELTLASGNLSPEHSAIVTSIVSSGGRNKVTCLQNINGAEYGIINTYFNVNSNEVTTYEDGLISNCLYIVRVRDSYMNSLSTRQITLTRDGVSETVEELPGTRFFNLPEYTDAYGDKYIWRDGSGNAVENGSPVGDIYSLTADRVRVTLSYQTNGAGSIASKTYKKGTAIGTLPSLSRTGYKFDGWFANAACTVKVSASTVITSDMTIYAGWTRLYLVTYDLRGGQPVTQFGAQYTEKGSYTVKWVMPSKDGYYFKGWKCGSKYLYPGDSISVSADTTLTAQWTDVIAAVTFDLTSVGGGISHQWLTYGSGIVLRNSSYQIDRTCINFPDCGGYADWYEKNPSDTDFNSGAQYIRLRNFTVYPDVYIRPVRRAIYYTEAGEVFYDQHVRSGEKVYVPSEMPEKSGYCFAGWSSRIGDTLPTHAPGMELNCDGGKVYEFYPVWRNDAYVIRYDSGFDDNAGQMPIWQLMDKYYLSLCITSTALEKTGYRFTGWHTDDTRADKRDYCLGDELSVPNGFTRLDTSTPEERYIVLTAQWEKLSYDVTLESADNTVKKVISCRYNEKYGHRDVFESSELEKPSGYYFDYFFDGERLVCPESTVERAEAHSLVLRKTEPIAEYKKKWYGRDVTLAKRYGITDGTMPDSNATRGQTITVLHRLAGSPTAGTNPFIDLRGGYADEPVSWAYGHGIAKGGNGYFNPNDDLTRTGAVLFVYRFCKAFGFDMTLTSSDTLDGFSDTAAIAALSTEAKTAFRWCVKQGIIAGTGSKLEPDGLFTRAQLAKVAVKLHRMLVYAGIITAA